MRDGDEHAWKCARKEGKCERTHSDSSRFRSTKCGANLIGPESQDHVKSLEGVEHRDLSFLSFLKAYSGTKRIRMDDSSDSASLVPGNASFWRQGKGRRSARGPIATHQDFGALRAALI